MVSILLPPILYGIINTGGVWQASHRCVGVRRVLRLRCPLISLVTSFPAAFLLLLAAAVTLPPTSRRLQQKIVLLSRSWVRIVVAVIAFSTAVRMMGGLEEAKLQPQLPQKEVQKTLNPVLAQHKVIPESVHGTTRIVRVIVQSNIAKDELVAVNDNLIVNFSDGLTHLNIEYFDDEAIATDYFQRLSQVSEAEGEKLFKHYIGTYTMNKISGVNRLNFNVGDNWVTIKEY